MDRVHFSAEDGASIPTEKTDAAVLVVTQFRTRVIGCKWGDWQKPGIGGWRAANAEREFMKPNSFLDGLCIDYSNGQRVTHFLAVDEPTAPADNRQAVL